MEQPLEQRRTTDMKVLDSLGKREHLDMGADSVVFRVRGDREVDAVLKVYNGKHIKPKDAIHPKNLAEVLKGYYDDTEKAKEITDVNPNPLNQSVQIENEKYELAYEVVSQGSILFNGTSLVGGKSERTIEVFGQRYVDGYNLKLLRMLGQYSNPEVGTDARISNIRKDETQAIFVGNVKLCAKLFDLINALFLYLKTSTRSPFDFDDLNVKPFIDRKTKKITIVITDLVADLCLFNKKYRGN